jgi:hypothetical protein
LPSQGKNGDIRGKFFRDSHLRNALEKDFSLFFDSGRIEFCEALHGAGVALLEILKKFPSQWTFAEGKSRSPSVSLWFSVKQEPGAEIYLSPKRVAQRKAPTSEEISKGLLERARERRRSKAPFSSS